MSIEIRPGVHDDSAATAAIYNQGIEEGGATFREEPVSEAETAGWIAASGTFPYLVAVEDGQVVGFAATGPYSNFPAYAGIGEYGIYIDRDHRRKGIGTRLLGELVAEAERQGLYKLTAKLMTTNDASIALAHRCGFEDVGVHVRHGKAQGQWRDVLVVERLLGEAAQ